jgi:hypothetical protein
MKAAFITSLVSATLSLIMILARSAMTVVPRAESSHSHIAMVLGVFFVVWLSLAFWLRPRAMPAPLPRWMRGLLVSTGAVYIIGILLLVIG